VHPVEGIHAQVHGKIPSTISRRGAEVTGKKITTDAVALLNTSSDLRNHLSSSVSSFTRDSIVSLLLLRLLLHALLHHLHNTAASAQIPMRGHDARKRAFFKHVGRRFSDT